MDQIDSKIKKLKVAHALYESSKSDTNFFNLYKSINSIQKDLNELRNDKFSERRDYKRKELLPPPVIKPPAQEPQEQKISRRARSQSVKFVEDDVSDFEIVEVEIPVKKTKRRKSSKKK